MPEGISIVICCYNSSTRLSQTLKHISLQILPAGFNWEVILIDNLSTDKTADIALKLWQQLGNPAELKIFQQQIPGLTASRKAGVENSKYDYVLFCDDDNWLNENYVNTGFEIMKGNSKIGILGGESVAQFETHPPEWFSKYQRSYSVGKQSDTSGDISNSSGTLWGAGMIVNKKAFQQLFSNGFEPLLKDRTGEILTSGGDTELCYALSMMGWKIWYDDRLKLTHYILSQRLKWSYIRKLHRGFGAQKVNFDLYTLVRNKNANEKYMHSDKWHRQVFYLIKKIRGFGLKKLFLFKNKNSEGDEDILRIEKSLGKLNEFLKIRGKYKSRINAVNNAQWRKIKNQTDVS